MSKLMTIKDAAKLLALSDSMIRKLVRSGRLTPVHIGRSVRIRLDDVEALVVRAAAPCAPPKVASMTREEDTDVDTEASACFLVVVRGTSPDEPPPYDHRRRALSFAIRCTEEKCTPSLI